MKIKREQGFTLVELLLAMAFFSFILLFVTTGFLIVSRAYTKGQTVKLIQDEGRELVEGMTREIRTSSSEAISVGPNDCIAIGESRYYWEARIDPSNTNSPRLMMKENGKTCADFIDTNNPSGESLLNERVGVQYISITPLPSSSAYSIKIVLSTAEADLVATPGENAACTTETGSQYCDVVVFTTVAGTR